MADEYKVDFLKKLVENFKGYIVGERCKTILHLYLQTPKTVSFIISFCNMDDVYLSG